MDFTAIDVETANADISSICQIGLAQYEGGRLLAEWESLIDPEDGFDPFNVWLHGIDENKVRGAPTLPQVADTLHNWLGANVAVCHTYFDRVSVGQAFYKYSVEPVQTTWLDTARVARRTWPQVARRGYSLAAVCELIGYKFRHHDALEDAKAAAHVLIAAMRETKMTVSDWLVRVKRPIVPGVDPHGRLHLQGNPEGPLHGEVIVFTGALQMVRREAAELAARVGCTVDPGITKHTTLLVLGDQDVRKLNGHDKSAKHRKAEALIAQGQEMRILRETDFKVLVASAEAA